MSKFKKSKFPGIVTSENNPDRLAAQTSPEAVLAHKKSKKKLLISAVLAIVLVGAGVGGYLWWQQKQDSKSQQNKTVKQMPQVVPDAQMDLYQKYSKLITEKKYDEARALVATMYITDAEKQAYYKDIDYLASDKTKELQGYLNKSNMSYQDASNAGDIYAQQGDTANAKKYYELAIKLSDEQNNPTGPDFKERVRAKINAL